MNIIECAGVGKRYGGLWALRDCTLGIPAGHVVALVGPNGAGKTTLLHLAVGLGTPSAGAITVLSGTKPGSSTALAGIAFVAQDAPLYRNLSVQDMLHLTRNLNGRWTEQRALGRAGNLDIPMAKKVGQLSRGQQAQLALCLALAREPRLLLLDEPLATLDPVARHDFMAVVMAAVVDDGLSVVLSSHVLAELDRVADYLVVLSRGRVQVSGSVEDLVVQHAVLMGPAKDLDRLNRQLSVVQTLRSEARVQVLVRARSDRLVVPPGWEAHKVGLEEVAMAYLRRTDAGSSLSSVPSGEAPHRGVPA